MTKGQLYFLIYTWTVLFVCTPLATYLVDRYG